MHSKTKGNIAEAAIALELTRLGYNVFKELGDLSKIDLVAEKDQKLIRIQCKGITPKKGVLILDFRKSGPNYSFRYNQDQFDIFAVCNLQTGAVCWIPNSYLSENRNGFHIRIEPAKNKQIQGVHSFSDYQDLDKILLQVI